MGVILAFIIGSVLSYIVTRILYNDTKAYNEGWENAKNIFDNWQLGYTEGWHDAEKYITKTECVNREKRKYLKEKSSVFADLW